MFEKAVHFDLPRRSFVVYRLPVEAKLSEVVSEVGELPGDRRRDRALKLLTEALDLLSDSIDDDLKALLS